MYKTSIDKTIKQLYYKKHKEKHIENRTFPNAEPNRTGRARKCENHLWVGVPNVAAASRKPGKYRAGKMQNV